MKKRQIPLAAWLLLCLVCAAGCGSGGGGESKSRPTLTEAQVHPTSLAASGGIVTIHAHVSGANVGWVRVTVRYPDGSEMEQGMAPVTDGYYETMLSLPANSGSVSQQYGFTVRVADSAGNVTATVSAGTLVVESDSDSGPPPPPDL